MNAISEAKLKEHCDFFFNDTATTEIYTLSLHDALPIYRRSLSRCVYILTWLSGKALLWRLVLDSCWYVNLI